MRKNTKNERHGAASADPVESVTPAAETTPQNSKTAKPSKTSAGRKTQAKRASAKRTTSKAGSKRTRKAKETREPSDADISLRAYFIAERRVQLALHGDPAKDWLEAKQQLLQEAAQKTA